MNLKLVWAKTPAWLLLPHQFSSTPPTLPVVIMKGLLNDQQPGLGSAGPGKKNGRGLGFSILRRRLLQLHRVTGSFWAETCMTMNAGSSQTRSTWQCLSCSNTEAPDRSSLNCCNSLLSWRWRNAVKTLNSVCKLLKHGHHTIWNMNSLRFNPWLMHEASMEKHELEMRPQSSGHSNSF